MSPISIFFSFPLSEGISLEALVTGSACFPPVLHPSLCFFFVFFFAFPLLSRDSAAFSSWWLYAGLQSSHVWSAANRRVPCLLVSFGLRIWPFVSTSVPVMLLLRLTPTTVARLIFVKMGFLYTCKYEFNVTFAALVCFSINRSALSRLWCLEAWKDTYGLNIATPSYPFILHYMYCICTIWILVSKLLSYLEMWSNLFWIAFVFAPKQASRILCHV